MESYDLSLFRIFWGLGRLLYQAIKLSKLGGLRYSLDFFHLNYFFHSMFSLFVLLRPATARSTVASSSMLICYAGRLCREYSSAGFLF